MTDAESGAATTLAVVVSPGVSPYLPRTLRGLAEQTRPVETVLVVDTSAPGRDVGTGIPVDHAIDDAGLRDVSHVRVVRVPPRRTFGAAVRSGLAELERRNAQDTARLDREPGPPARWLWLLHDDSAPEPAAHAELVRTGESGPSIAVAGPKQRDWARPDLILEAGLRTTSTGRRLEDIEAGEIDQGQYDSRQDVLAVGTAGALVRRAVWDELGGPDPALGPFSDGLDLSQRAWLAGHRVVLVPGAVVHHARASYHGLREGSARADTPAVPDARRSFAARRRAQLFVWLTTAPWYWVPFVVAAILLLAPLRALWRLATKELTLVGAEMRAAAEVLARPVLVWRARRRHRRTRTVPHRYLRPLRATWREVAKAKRDERRSIAAGRVNREAPSELELRERAELARRRRGTLALVLVGLTAVAMTAFGPLLVSGALRGGALAPLDASARQLWRAATSAWVGAGLGHAGPADPLLTVLALLQSPLALFGASGNVLTTTIVVLSVPLAGLGAWFAGGAATRSVLLRAWAAAVWALAPALLLATGEGRLGALLAHLLLPWVALGTARAMGVQRRDVIVPGIADADRDAGAEPPAGHVAAVPSTALERPERRSGTSVAAAAGAGLALAGATAGAPILLPAALVALLVLTAVVPRRRLLALVALPPVLLLGPLWTAAVQDVARGSWRVLLTDPGVPFATGAPAPAWLVALGWPVEAWPTTLAGEPWLTAVALAGGAAVAVIAVLALLRGTGRARAVRAGWVVAVVGLAAALLSSRTPTGIGADAAGGAAVAHGWPGAGVSLALLGLLVAVTSAGDGMRAWLSSRSFGWRHLTAVVVVALMVLAPAATTGLWLTELLTRRGDAPHLHAVEGRVAPPVPAVGRELQTGPERARTLALYATEDGIRAEVWRHAGPQLSGLAASVTARDLTGTPAEPAAPDDAGAELMSLTAQLATGSATDAGEQLGRMAVGVVLVPPADAAETTELRQALIARLDATPGLEPVTENDSGVIWRTSRSAGQPGAARSVARVRVVGDDGAVLDSLPSGDIEVDAQVPAGPEGRRVVLAERADGAWRATYNGRSLRATTDGWRQAFELPAHTGNLKISYEPAWHRPWQVAQLVGLGVTVLLAIPVRRRREEVRR